MLDRFRLMVKPEYNDVVDKKIFKLTSIQNKDVREACILCSALEQFEYWLGTEPIKVYTWSGSDLLQIKKECDRKEISTLLLDEGHTKWVDIQRIFDILTDSSQKTSLKNAIYFCGIDLKGQEHDAFYDAIHTAEIAKYIKSGEVSRIKRHNDSLICREPLKSWGGIPLEQRRKLEELLKVMSDRQESAIDCCDDSENSCNVGRENKIAIKDDICGNNMTC